MTEFGCPGHLSSRHCQGHKQRLDETRIQCIKFTTKSKTKVLELKLNFILQTSFQIWTCSRGGAATFELTRVAPGPDALTTTHIQVPCPATRIARGYRFSCPVLHCLTHVLRPASVEDEMITCVTLARVSLSSCVIRQ